VTLKLLRLLLAAALALVWGARPSAAKEFTPDQQARITQVVGTILERGHYRQAALDDALSEQFLKNYLDALDYNHMVFLQSDVDEFKQRYARSLDDLTKGADPKPAFEIFARYLKRLEERQELVERLLKQDFDFTVDESYIPARNKEPWPKDDVQAEELWRLRIKGELLQDRLAKLTADKKKDDQAKAVTPDSKPGQKTGATDTDAKATATEPRPDKPYDPTEAIKTISKRYQRLLKTMREFDSEEILGTYLTALAHAFDPHTDYLGPTEVENFDITNVKLKLTGIGASLRFNDGYTEVVQLITGGPADLSKLLRPKDRIIAVAQGDGEWVDVIEMKLSKVVQMIRGKPDTKVRLMLIPASSTDSSERKEITLTRAEVKLVELHAKARIAERTNETGSITRLGVITLPEFYENAAADTLKLIQRLKQEQVNGLVLDLRRNGGGLLHQAIALTGLFIKGGPVVQVKDNRKQTQILADEEEDVAYDGPLVVLVSHLSASASEIVAAALQDYGRAVIVGDKTTHGKGTVQSLISLNQFARFRDLANPGKLKMTVSKFYRVAGGTTQKYGVTPDVILPSVLDYMELGEASLPNALSADETAPATYAKVGRVGPTLDELRKRSAERVGQSDEFGYTNEDIERLKKQRELKIVSLDEATRLKEKLDDKKRAEARKQARAARQARKDKVFELTLESVEKNQPLQVAGAPKAKDEEQLAAATTADPTEDAATEAEAEPPVDAHLDETLSILADLHGLEQQAHGEPLAGTKPSKVEPKPGVAATP
jgi:carboxyl-terminal processing protease